jgi:hypothetical protein
MYLRLIGYLLFGAAVFGVVQRFHVNFRYEDFKDYLALLSGVSGGVFTIMGIWIAFLYPNALSRLVDPKKVVTADFSESLADTKRLENIVAAILKSALVMTAALIIAIAKVFLYLSPYYAAHIELFKSLALSVLAVITVLQIEAVFSVMASNVMFINDLHRKRLERKADHEL